MPFDEQKYHAQIAATISKAALDGKLPWLNPVPAGARELPHNPFEERPGQGARVFNNVTGLYLDCVAAEHGWTDPRWIDANDIMAAKGRLAIKYGEQPVVIAVKDRYNEMTAVDRTSKTPERIMYNAAQVRGLPPYEYGRVSDFIQARRDHYVTNSGMPLESQAALVSEYLKANTKDPTLAPVLGPIAQYNLALATGTEYVPPSNSKDLAFQYVKAPAPETQLMRLYNANKLAVKLSNEGFAFTPAREFQSGRGRQEVRDHDRVAERNSIGYSR